LGRTILYVVEPSRIITISDVVQLKKARKINGKNKKFSFMIRVYKLKIKNTGTAL